LEDIKVDGSRFKLEEVLQHASSYETRKQQIEQERIQKNKEWRKQMAEREKQLGIEKQEP
jgi:hypothetical protein